MYNIVCSATNIGYDLGHVIYEYIYFWHGW